MLRRRRIFFPPLLLSLSLSLSLPTRPLCPLLFSESFVFSFFSFFSRENGKGMKVQRGPSIGLTGGGKPCRCDAKRDARKQIERAKGGFEME